jgi:hypothetical protein
MLTSLHWPERLVSEPRQGGTFVSLLTTWYYRLLITRVLAAAELNCSLIDQLFSGFAELRPLTLRNPSESLHREPTGSPSKIVEKWLKLAGVVDNFTQCFECATWSTLTKDDSMSNCKLPLQDS